MENLKKELETLKSLQEENKKVLNALNSNMYQELQAIRDKYAVEQNGLEAKEKELNEQVVSLNKQIKEAQIMEDWKSVQERGEINESYLSAMMRFVDDNMLHGTYSIKDIIRKPMLKNGIAVWKIYVDTHPQNYNLYLAFKGTELVGTSYRDEAKHAGDATTPFSFIGQFEKVLQKQVESQWNEGEFYTTNMTFTDWYKELAKLDALEITTLPMNMDTLQQLKAGVQSRWNEYVWEKISL